MTYRTHSLYLVEALTNEEKPMNEKKQAEKDLSEVFYDSVNGADLPMTFEDICDEVQCNPLCSSQESADEKYYFSADESLSYSVQEIADLINITLEIFDEEV